MNSGLRGQIYNNLSLKETDELLDIWKTNDRIEWSETTFEVLEEVLKQRIGDLPAQEEPILDFAQHAALTGDDLEEWESRLLDSENQPDFYDTLEVLTLNDRIRWTAKAIIVVNLALAILNFQTVRDYLWDSFRQGRRCREFCRVFV